MAQWSFDEGSGSVAYDATESNNDGTLHLDPSGNTATSSAWVSGEYGSAMSFDDVRIYNYAMTAEQIRLDYSVHNFQCHNLQII